MPLCFCFNFFGYAAIPGWGRSHGGGHGQPLQYSCLETPRGQRRLAGCRPRGHKESDMTEWLSTAGCVACRILVPQAGIEPAAPALEVRSLNHQTTREVPLGVVGSRQAGGDLLEPSQETGRPRLRPPGPTCRLVTGVSKDLPQHLPVWSLNVSVSDYRALSAFQDSVPSLPKASNSSSYPVGTEQMLVKCK